MDINRGAMTLFMRTKECCVCIPPSIGISILASLSIISSIFHCISLVIALASSDFGVYGSLLIYISILLMAMHILNIIIRSLLIMGVKKNKPSLMFPSICVDFTGLLSFIPVTFTVFAIPFLSLAQCFLSFFVLLTVIFLMSHYFSVTYRYYEDLRSQCYERLTDQVAESPLVV